MDIDTTKRSNALRYGVEYPATARFPEHLDLSIEDTRIPASRYTSPGFARREVEEVWKRSWQFACREEDIPDPGDYVIYRLDDQEWLVTRQEDGSIRALVNSCRHRGNVLRRTGSGQVAELRCPYHRWAWELDGSLKEIPDAEMVPAACDSAGLCLPQARIECWAGFVFLTPDPEAAPLRQWLGDVVDQLDPYHMEDMRVMTSASTTISCNWKVAVEAFLETYHVPGIHPQVMRYMDDWNTAYEIHGRHSRMFVPFGVASMRLGDLPDQAVLEAYLFESGQTRVTTTEDADEEAAGYKADEVGDTQGLFGDDGEMLDYEHARRYLIERNRDLLTEVGRDVGTFTDSQLVDDWHYFIYPSMVFNLRANGFLLFRIMPHPDGPDRCRFDLYRFGFPRPGYERPRHVEVDEGAMSFGRILDQDFRNLPGVQRGLRQDATTHVVLSRQEVRIVEMHRAIDRQLGHEGPDYIDPGSA